MTILERKLDALMRFAAADNEFDIANIRTEIRLLLCEFDPTAIYSAREREVRSVLLSLNAPEHMAGYQYLVEAILLGIEKEDATSNMSWGIYAPIALEHDSNIDKVSGAIQTIIDAIWDRASYELLAKYFSGLWDAEKGRPSPKPFITRLANIIRFDLAKQKGADRKCL